MAVPRMNHFFPTQFHQQHNQQRNQEGHGPFSNGMFNAMNHNMRAQAAFMEEQRRREQEQARRERGPPPASRTALKNIPEVKVAAHDLTEETNRSCSVCLDDFELGDMAVKLPCAHIFHRECVWEWLELHCTCPVCRFELETEDRNYEKERKVRMQGRRPRYRRRELEALSIPQIRNLARAQNVSIAGCLEKADIVRRIADSGTVEVIDENNPEFDHSQLVAMSARQLRTLMLELGIDVEGCLEKRDMLDRVLSSRLVTVTHNGSSDGRNDYGTHNSDYTTYSSGRTASPASPPPPPPPPPPPATAQPPAREEATAQGRGGGRGQAQGGAWHTSSNNERTEAGREEPTARRPWWRGLGRTPAPAPAPAPAPRSSNLSPPAEAQSVQSTPLDSMSVKELRTIMAGLGISMAGCIEKRDMVERIRGSGRYQPAGGGGGGAR